MSDALGHRMKLYEGIEADRMLMPLLPILARMDGRCFHAFTRGMNQPFDMAFASMMIGTTEALMHETNASMGYTQSDEITLAWHSTDNESQVWFNGRIAKMVSQLAAQATLHFYRSACDLKPIFASRLPTFDARVWQVPNRTEGANAFLWREWDATKNSISMAASTVYSDKELFGKNGDEKQEMLFQKGINWNDYGSHSKRGTFVQKRMVTRAFTVDEIDKLPPRHFARTNPDLKVERSEIMALDMPPFAKVTNREDVIFEGAEPLVEQPLKL